MEEKQMQQRTSNWGRVLWLFLLAALTSIPTADASSLGRQCRIEDPEGHRWMLGERPR